MRSAEVLGGNDATHPRATSGGVPPIDMIDRFARSIFLLDQIPFNLNDLLILLSPIRENLARKGQHASWKR